MDRVASSSRSHAAVLILAAAFLLIVQDFAHLNAATVTSRKPKNEVGGQNCTNHMQTIDRCSSLATYSYTTSFNQYPNNSAELKQSCDRIGEGLKCLKTNAKCLSPIARRSLNSFSSARSRHSKRLCSNVNDPKSVDFIKSSECVFKASKRPLMVASERELISAIQMLALNTTMKWDNRFHSACCAAASYKTKALKDMEPECAKFKDTQEDMLNSMIGELLESACPEQARLNDICSKLAKLNLPKTWKAASLTGAALDLIVALADSPSKE